MGTHLQASMAYLNEALKEVGKEDDRAMLERLPVSSGRYLPDVQ